MISRTSGGNAVTSGTSALPPAVAACGNRSANRDVTRLASTAPSALTPIAPPMLRKNVSDDVFHRLQ